MELGEALATNVITDNHDETCYFCTADKEPEDLVNGMTDKYDEDADIDGVTFHNDSGELASSLGGSPGVKNVRVDSKSKPCSTAAHHLIPGNAALKPSKLMAEKWMWKEGMAKGNIGYEVNSRPNGVWLPGNYAVRPWSSLGDVFKQDYAFAAIKEWGRQFHDAHTDYSNEVLKALDAIAEKLKKNEDLWCEKAKNQHEKGPDERNPLYGIVARLHTLSARCKAFLVAPEANWNVRMYTSRFSLMYINSMTPDMDDD